MKDGMKVWFITGVSRGLGRALAQAVLASGDKVIGTVRGQQDVEGGKVDNLHFIQADLSNPLDATRAANEAFSLFGHVDVVVNNAGFGAFGAIEDLRDVDLERVFEVNVFAAIRICRAAIPFFRDRGKGHLINITSIAGRAPGPATAAYAATKAAIDGFSAALAQEVGPLGIHVTAVVPGQFRTDFLKETAGIAGTASGGASQGPVCAALSTLSKINQNQIGDPKKAAQAILAVVAATHPPTNLLLGSDAWARANVKLDMLKAEMDLWQDITESTDY